MEHWSSDIDSDGIAWLCLDKADSSANVLSAPVLGELNEALTAIVDEGAKGLVIYSGKSNGFVMGADIKEFTKIESPDQAYELIRSGQQVIDRVEALPFPSVAVINGFALGGGLELAMACSYRLAFDIDKSIIGLPEVQLGLHPGFGGTVRAVQLAGVRQAMPLMLTGKSIRPSKAKAIGLVDALTPADSWKNQAHKLLTSRPPKSRAPLTDRLLGFGPIRPFIKKTLVAQVAGKARKDHYPAPYAMIDLWAEHGASTSTGYEAEARSMAQLMCSDTAKNLIRVFFLQNRLKSQGTKTATRIQHVHVIGAGVMGGDIAAWCALRGLDVTLQDREHKYIQPALDRAAKLYAKRIRNADKREKALQRLQPDVSGDGLEKADLVIEAIFEDLDAKQALYKDAQARMKPGAILSTNTSSIRLEDLRGVLDAPTRFIGLHFFNPVAQLPLVEVIHCDDTDEETMDAGFAFVKAIGKFPLACSSAPGFVVNRLLSPYMAEAMHLHNDGVSLPLIDKAAEAFGMPMGPVELVDSVGLDVALGVSRVLGAAFDRPLPEGLEDRVASGNLGRKTGEGFYKWVDGKAQKPPAGDQQAPDDTADRLMLPMVNEAVACLSESVVKDADLLDAGVIFGTGFAPFRGGPLNYARDRGVDEVVARLEALAERYGERFRPHPGWEAFKASDSAD